MKLRQNNVRNFGGPSSSSGDGGGTGDFGERLVRLEEKVNHLATSEHVSEIKELIQKNDANVKELIHANEISIKNQQLINLKWGVTLAVTSFIAIVATVLTILSKYLPST